MQNLMQVNFEKFKNISIKGCEHLKKGFEFGLKDKSLTNNSVRSYWVKTRVSSREFNTHYLQHPTYTFLEKDKDGVLLGYCVGNEIPQGCVECNFQDLEKIQYHRRQAGIRPLPLSEKEFKQNKAKEYEKEAFDVLAKDSEQFLKEAANLPL